MVWINPNFEAILAANGLTTFEDFWNIAIHSVARHVGQRLTARVELATSSGTHPFYIKRHGQPPLKEMVKPLLRFTWPVLGARPEWEAIRHFEDAGVPTMIAVAFSEQPFQLTTALGLSSAGGRSFLMTESLEGYTRLDHWLFGEPASGLAPSLSDPARTAEANAVLRALASLASRIHTAGLHHQDFYLCHILYRVNSAAAGGPADLRVIDLGRVRKHTHLPKRWRNKDLSQFLYSSQPLGEALQNQWLEWYLERPLAPNDGTWVCLLRAKAARIGRHTRRNSL